MNKIILSLILICSVIISGCGPSETQLSTGKVLTPSQLPIIGVYGDVSYSIVQSSALPFFYQDFRDILTKQGLVKWDNRYDCNHFASLYISLAQAKYAVASFQSYSTAQTLAMAEIWYRPTWAKGQGHAIVAIQTEKGLLFIEPQTGEMIVLTNMEKDSIFLAKW